MEILTFLIIFIDVYSVNELYSKYKFFHFSICCMHSFELTYLH